MKGRRLCCCMLSREDRYWGYEHDYYDGPIDSFGFWFFHIYLM